MDFATGIGILFGLGVTYTWVLAGLTLVYFNHSKPHQIMETDKRKFFQMTVFLFLYWPSVWWFGGWGPKACGSMIGEFEKARIEARDGKSEEKSEEKRED